MNRTFESPFLDEELFGREQAPDWERRRSALVSESPFLDALVPGAEDSEALADEAEPDMGEEAYVEEGESEAERVLDLARQSPSGETPEGDLIGESHYAEEGELAPEGEDLEPEEEPEQRAFEEERLEPPDVETEEPTQEGWEDYDQPELEESESEAVLDATTEEFSQQEAPPRKALREPMGVPKGNEIPFAEPPPLGTTCHWPIKASAKEGRLVSYLAQDGTTVGSSGRMFLARRSTKGKERWHVGIDLYARPGDEVRACEDGVIVGFGFFYKARTGQDTYQLLVEHPGERPRVVVNYGEVTDATKKSFRLGVGSTVRAGQPIGIVSDTRMLHFETYLKGTRSNRRWMKSEKNPPSELLNPTKYLLFLQEHGLPEAGAVAPASRRPSIDVAKAVRLNKHYAQKLGWREHFGSIVRLLGFADSKPGEGQFAEAVAEWQRSRGLRLIDGVVGPETWGVLRTALGIDRAVGQRPKTGLPSQTRPATELRQRIVEIAKQEWEKWGRGTRKETESEMEPILRSYWEAVRVTGERADKFIKKRYFWSAAFICWVMREAGAADRFKRSSYHSVYLAAARDHRRSGDTSKFWAYRFAEVAPELGDLVCQDRKVKSKCAKTDYDNVDVDPEKGRDAHSDIVIERANNRIRVIGGNVGDSVGANWVDLDPRGHLPALAKDGCPYIAVIKPPGARPALPTTPS